MDGRVRGRHLGIGLGLGLGAGFGVGTLAYFSKDTTLWPSASLAGAGDSADDGGVSSGVSGVLAHPALEASGERAVGLREPPT